MSAKRKVSKTPAAKKTAKRKPPQPRLGRGLGALLGDARAASSSTATDRNSDGGTRLRQLPIEQLQRGAYQPRANFDRDALSELAESIKAQGVIQPLLVREVGRDRFEIIAGERRWRGAQLAGLAAVPAVVQEMSDQSAMATALIENIQREDLSPLEEAAGFQRLLDEFGLTHQQIADAVGRSRAAVTNALRLQALHPAAQKLLADGSIEMGHARALLALPTERQAEAADKVVAGGLTVRRTEALVKQLLAGGDTGGGGNGGGGNGGEKHADILRLEEKLSAQLGAQVSIQHRAKRGKLVIHYHSLEQLDGILERIK